MISNIFFIILICFSNRVVSMEESFSDQENERFMQKSAEMVHDQSKSESVKEPNGQESFLGYELGLLYDTTFQDLGVPFLSTSKTEDSGQKVVINNNLSVMQQKQIAGIMKLRSGRIKTNYINNAGQYYPYPVITNGRKKNVKKESRCPYPSCEKSYHADQHLKAHIKSFHQRLIYRCLVDTCGEIFNDSHRRTCHTKKEHPVESKSLYPFECDICHDRFAKKNYLTGHENRYKGDCKELKSVENADKSANIVQYSLTT